MLEFVRICHVYADKTSPAKSKTWNFLILASSAISPSMPGHRLTQQPQTVSWSSLESQKSAKEQGSIRFKHAMSSSSQSTWEATKGFSFQTPGCKRSLAAFPSPESTSLLGLVTMTLAELPTALATKQCWEMSTMPWVYNTALKCHLSHLSIQGATVEEATGSLSSVIYSLVKSFTLSPQPYSKYKSCGTLNQNQVCYQSKGSEILEHSALARTHKRVCLQCHPNCWAFSMSMWEICTYGHFFKGFKSCSRENGERVVRSHRMDAHACDTVN